MPQPHKYTTMFKAPSSVPQDLLLIHNLVSTPSTQVAQELKKVIPKIDSEESSIASSNDGSDSEDSIEKVDRLVDADIEKGGSPEARYGSLTLVARGSVN